MSSPRTMWHVLFAELLKEFAPPGFEVQTEVTLATEPQRADYVIIRRETTDPTVTAQTLTRLWPLIPLRALLEYKSVMRPIRAGELARLIGYGAQYQAEKIKDLLLAADLVLGLVVASITPTLDEELARFRWTREPLGNGYYVVPGCPWALYVIVVDEVSKAEQDALLALVGHGVVHSEEAVRWMLNHTVWSGKMTEMAKLEGYPEAIEQMLARLPANLRVAGLKPEERVSGLKPEERLSGLKPEERLSGLKPEERLSGLKPEERLSGLSSDEQVLALAPQVLAMLMTSETMARLAPEVRVIVEQRLAAFRAHIAH